MVASVLVWVRQQKCSEDAGGSHNLPVLQAMVRRPLKYFTLLFLLTLTITFYLTAFKRFRLRFENGRFFDETNSTVVKEHSILVYFLLSAIEALLTIILTINLIRTQRKYDK
jgi:hypothetical protein